VGFSVDGGVEVGVGIGLGVGDWVGLDVVADVGEAQNSSGSKTVETGLASGD
jgi:hypothetical protein